MPGLIDKLEARAASLEDPGTPVGDGFTLLDALVGGRPTITGRHMNSRKAKTFSAVWSAISTISGTMATLPLKVYRRRDDGGKDEARDHPAWSVLHDAPNPRMTAASYREAGQGHLLTRGNSYTEIVTDGRGRVSELWPLDPDKVEIRDTESGDIVYLVRTSDGPRIFMPEEVLHVPGLGFDGRSGWSIIALARESLALGLAAEEYASRFFGNSAQPRGILTHPESLGDQAKRTLKEQWEQAHRGLDRSHRVAVLEEGVQWQQIGLTNEDAQFLEMRKFQVREVARWYNIPPHKIADMEDATFSNIAEQNIEYLQDTIQPWITRWEQAINRRVFTDRERSQGLFAEFQVQGLLRSDPDSRANLYTALLQNGAISPNQIAARENLNPVEGGDRRFIQLNMVPLDQAGQMPDAIGGDDEGQASVRSRNGYETRTPAMRLRLRASFLPLFQDAAERMVRGEIRNVRRGKERTLSESQPDAFIEWLSEYYMGEHPEFASTTLGPVFRSYADSVAQAVAEEVGRSEVPMSLDSFLDGYTQTFANRYSASSRRQLQRIVREAEAEERGAAVDERLGEWEEGTPTGRPRAERVSGRHVVEVGEAVSATVMAAAGILALRWQTISDSCPYCRRLNGTVVSVQRDFVGAGEKFDGDGTETPLVPKSSISHPPLHKGCDCVIVSG